MDYEPLKLKPTPSITPKEFWLRLSYNASCFLVFYAYQLYVLVLNAQWSEIHFFAVTPIIPLALTFLLYPLVQPPFSPNISRVVSSLPSPLVLIFGPILLCVLLLPPIAVTITMVNFSNPHTSDIGNGSAIITIVVVLGIIILVGEIIAFLFPKLLGESEHVFIPPEDLLCKFLRNIWVGAIVSFTLSLVLIFTLDYGGTFTKYSGVVGLRVNKLYILMNLAASLIIVLYSLIIANAEPPKSFKYLGKFKAAIIGEMLWYVGMLLTYGGAKLCQILF